MNQILTDVVMPCSSLKEYLVFVISQRFGGIFVYTALAQDYRKDNIEH
jgi:hypothetical protein